MAAQAHGAYFGVASVLAGNLVTAQKRSSAMAVVFAGLTTANVIGVPLMTLVGQHSSWRICYLLVGAIEVLAAGCVAAVVPIDGADAAGQAPKLRHELRAFGQSQIWLSLAIAMIDGAGLFASFSYISAVTIYLFPFCALAILPALQSRIIALAGGAPNLAAASIHAAFNIANSLGAWLGGITIAAGLGYGAPNLVAAGLAALGLGIALISGRLERRAGADSPRHLTFVVVPEHNMLELVPRLERIGDTVVSRCSAKLRSADSLDVLLGT